MITFQASRLIRKPLLYPSELRGQTLGRRRASLGMQVEESSGLLGSVSECTSLSVVQGALID
jgi:hypothetical protein